MRWNDYKHDAVGMQGCRRSPSASNAISERADLTAADAGCINDVALSDEGGIDVKFTSTAWADDVARTWGVRAQSGPTYDVQPPFAWSTSPFASHPHVGQPDVWQFPYVNFTFPNFL